MSKLKVEQLEAGAQVFFVASGNMVKTGAIVAVKKRGSKPAQVCLDMGAELALEDFFDEKFFPNEQEAWYAVAMFAQRHVEKSLAVAKQAFNRAGIASPEPPASPGGS